MKHEHETWTWNMKHEDEHDEQHVDKHEDDHEDEREDEDEDEHEDEHEDEKEEDEEDEVVRFWCLILGQMLLTSVALFDLPVSGDGMSSFFKRWFFVKLRTLCWDHLLLARKGKTVKAPA